MKCSEEELTGGGGREGDGWRGEYKSEKTARSNDNGKDKNKLFRNKQIVSSENNARPLKTRTRPLISTTVDPFLVSYFHGCLAVADFVFCLYYLVRFALVANASRTS